jgi:hypothetical protein
MIVSTELRKRIEKKQQEISELEAQIREHKTYLQALLDIAKLMPKDGASRAPNIRPNSSVAKAREALQKAGQPLHVTKILEAMGRHNTKKERLSLSGSLSQYVRNDEIFSRPEPNVFGLLEWDSKDSDVGTGADVVEMLEATK